MSERPDGAPCTAAGGLDTAPELQDCLRDLVGMLALPALWEGRPPQGVLDVLLDALGAVVPARVAYARVPVSGASPAIEAARVAGKTPSTARTAALRAGLGPAFGVAPFQCIDLDLTPYVEIGWCRAMLVPLGFYGATGVLVLGFCEPGGPTERDRVIVRAAASLAAAGIESARRLELRRQAEQQLWALADASISIHAAGSPDQIAAEAARAARRLLGAKRAIARLTPVPALAPVPVAVPVAVPVPVPVPVVDEGRDAAVFLEREDVPVDAPATTAAAPNSASGSASVPGRAQASLEGEVISREGRRLGALRVEREPDRPFTDADRAVLAQLGQAVASALDHAWLVAAAREADRRKDEFLALLGHELRNPLAPIVTALQLMKLRGDQQGSRERQVIERQVLHMSQLVDDLLDIARVTRGKLELRASRVELAAVVDRATEMASPLIEQRRHVLRVTVPRAGLEVDADPARLAQVFANLLTNAAKYTDPGGTIDVHASRDGGTITAIVRDTGHGLAPEILEQIFEPFVQVGRRREALAGGLGLGLPLVRSLVELHGGRVHARSPGPGLGSELVVELPASLRPAAAVEEPASGAAGLVPPEHRRRVLVVDDNQDAGQLVADVLSALGHEVDVAQDGPEALERAARFRPEVAVLDIGLPVMDGHELGRHLRALLGDGLRLIALTGYGQESDHAASSREGFAAHLVKPIDLDRLSAAVIGAR